MPGDMSGDIFFNPAEICYFFEIAVHFLIAGNWQQSVFLLASRMLCVFAENLQRNIKQGNVAHVLRLLARLANPIIAIVILNDMFGR